MAKERKIKKDNLDLLPKEAGVYIFCGKKGEILYIGKANNLKERVKNHFNQPNYKDNLFINEVEKIGYIPLSSEVEALILESQLIKKLQPKFNILFRDDKNYFYVGITNEDWPRIFLTHQIKIKNQKGPFGESPKATAKIKNTFIGPFTDGTSLKEALKILRKIFPYRSCKSFPKRPCLWHYLEKCPAPCLLEKERKIRKDLENQTKKRQIEYKKNIKKLKEVLEGKRKTVINSLKKEMKKFAEKEEFEKAAELRDKIMALEKVFSHKIVLGQKFSEEKINEGKALKEVLGLKNIPRRIEGYDVSNIQSNEMVGAMTVFSLVSKNFEKNIKEYTYLPNKKEYRLFKIKTVKKQNDIACLREIISRRLAHKEWQMPDLIYVDGGKAQFNAANEVIQLATNNLQQTTNDKQLATQNKRQATIPVISLAKRKNILYTNTFNKPLSLDKLDKVIKMTILRLKDETHRFAINYHRKLRRKKFLK
jgi:excinuclease ABC subunit C